jgi:hypothetical protein
MLSSMPVHFSPGPRDMKITSTSPQFHSDPVSVFSYFLPKGKKFASGKKKAFSILAKNFALLVLAFAEVKIDLAIFANIESLHYC